MSKQTHSTQIDELLRVQMKREGDTRIVMNTVSAGKTMAERSVSLPLPEYKGQLCFLPVMSVPVYFLSDITVNNQSILITSN